MHDSDILQMSQDQTIQIIDETNKQNTIKYIFDDLPSTLLNLNQNEQFVDQQFIMPMKKDDPNIKIKRLFEIFAQKLSLFIDMKTGKQLSRATKNKLNQQRPTYLSQINILPFQHYCNLIDPPYVNKQGYYYIIAVKNGVMHKMIIDDKFYYNQQSKQFIIDKRLKQHLWVYILIKAWAKINKGFQNLQKCEPFEFIRAFSFPDWQTMNPNKQKKQIFINKLSKTTKNMELLIAKTKSSEKVGYFGLVPSCSSFVITGYHQEYGQIYIKILTHVFAFWNDLRSSGDSHSPQQMPQLNQNQFLMPYKQFLNVFHLIYSTGNKYIIKNSTSYIQTNQSIKTVHYDKFTLNIDALQNNAFVLAIQLKQILKNQINKCIRVGLSFYFPYVKQFDVERHNQKQKQICRLGQLIVPRCKIMIGKCLAYSSMDPNHASSIKQKFLQQGYNHQINYSSNVYYDYVISDYLKGYSNQIAYNLSLTPGRYLIRLKLEKKIMQYSCFLSTTTINGLAEISDTKADFTQQITILKDCLLKKAILQQKILNFESSHGSWVCCRDQHQALGYSYIVVHVAKNADYLIHAKINSKLLKQNGYKIKNNKQINQKQIITSKEKDSVIILKRIKQWPQNKVRNWPPKGIQFLKVQS